LKVVVVLSNGHRVFNAVNATTLNSTSDKMRFKLSNFTVRCLVDRSQYVYSEIRK